ncbi:MAG TPA: pyridoxamine 5'-phosphate oxidase family protein [Candidatus Acidoferrum sp.]|nr:pyridoxamine 5'-phosphate oxidase family protein [Candidatus Acidoferrum sp.]
MSDQESNNFLSSGRILRIASIGADGAPHIAPIWYVYENGKFYVQTGPRSRKTGNIRANSTVAFSIDVGEKFYDLKAVVGKGTARILTDTKFNHEMGKKILLKYLGDLNNPAATRKLRTRSHRNNSNHQNQLGLLKKLLALDCRGE